MNKTIHVLHYSNDHRWQDAIYPRRNATTDQGEDLKVWDVFQFPTFNLPNFNIQR
jgi:hypothetical protein